MGLQIFGGWESSSSSEDGLEDGLEEGVEEGADEGYCASPKQPPSSGQRSGVPRLELRRLTPSPPLPPLSQRQVIQGTHIRLARVETASQTEVRLFVWL